MKVAVPRTGAFVAPSLGHCTMMSIYTIRSGHVVDQLDFPLRSPDPLDRVRLLRDQQVETIICGGIQDLIEDILRASGMTVISWVSGAVGDLLDLFIHGQLVPCPDRATAFGAGTTGPVHRDKVH
jgi:predicted Fe-Mo cluster-binding NifX family protein